MHSFTILGRLDGTSLPTGQTNGVWSQTDGTVKMWIYENISESIMKSVLKVLDMPLLACDEAMFHSAGNVMGLVHEVDVDSGTMYVTVDGLSPLIFKMVVPFVTGGKVVVFLEYNKLVGYCKHCRLLT